MVVICRSDTNPARGVCNQSQSYIKYRRSSKRTRTRMYLQTGSTIAQHTYVLNGKSGTELNRLTCMFNLVFKKSVAYNHYNVNIQLHMTAQRFIRRGNPDTMAYTFHRHLFGLRASERGSFVAGRFRCPDGWMIAHKGRGWKKILPAHWLTIDSIPRPGKSRPGGDIRSLARSGGKGERHLPPSLSSQWVDGANQPNTSRARYRGIRVKPKVAEYAKTLYHIDKKLLNTT